MIGVSTRTVTRDRVRISIQTVKSPKQQLHQAVLDHEQQHTGFDADDARGSPRPEAISRWSKTCHILRVQ